MINVKQQIRGDAWDKSWDEIWLLTTHKIWHRVDDQLASHVYELVVGQIRDTLKTKY